MRSKFFHAIAVAGIFALAGCSDEAKPTPVSLGEGPDNPELSSDSEGGELPPGGDTGTLSSGASTLPGTSSPSGNNPADINSSATGESGNPEVTSSESSSQLTTSSETAQEQTYAFGYAMGNAPTPSKGCGKNSTLQQKGSNSNAKKYSMRSADLDRAFWLTLPKNYDNNKPYKILFAMHCMGSNAEDFTQHTPDYDHPSPYYGQQNLDTENNYIFVSPESNSNSFGPWRMDDKDHRFFGDMLTLIEENYCIDTSRVFVTGFSFGAMFTNSLSWDFQDRIRAVAVYATAAYNIYLPEKKNLPIAWMGVHGKNDETCPYKTNWNPGARDSALVQILRFNSAEGKNAVNEKENGLQEIADNQAGHLCYDFKDVDPRFPVKWCSWNGPHRWAAHDEYDYANINSPESWKKTWVPKVVHEFFEQF